VLTARRIDRLLLLKSMEKTYQVFWCATVSLYKCSAVCSTFVKCKYDLVGSRMSVQLDMRDLAAVKHLVVGPACDPNSVR